MKTIKIFNITLVIIAIIALWFSKAHIADKSVVTGWLLLVILFWILYKPVQSHKNILKVK